MAQIRPKILTRYGRQNEPLRVPIIDLLMDPSAMTYLGADTASGSGTLTVLNISGFAVNQIIIIGDPGNQSCEIIKTHASTPPSGTTITLASNTVQNHSAGTMVRVINFDQVELSNAPTVGGTKTVMTTTNLTVYGSETTYNDTTNTSGFYYGRFKNSITAAFSSYSDPVPYAGYTQLSARWVIDSALKNMNKETSEILSDDYGFLMLNNFQTEVLQEQKRWNFLQNFNASQGQQTTGQWRVAVPTDLDDQYSDRSTWHARIGKQDDMTWVDKNKWDELTAGLAFTTLANALNVGNTTATLTDSSNFDDSGTLQIAGNTYAFTANNRSTNVITLSAAVASGQNAASGANVFMGATLGEPKYFTIFGGFVWYYPVLSSDFNNRDLFLDYYKAQTLIALDSDNLVVPDQTAAVYYLQAKFLERLNQGKPTEDSISLMAQFEKRKTNMKNKNTLGRTFRLKPRKNTLDMNDYGGNDPRSVRLGNFPNS